MLRRWIGIVAVIAVLAGCDKPKSDVPVVGFAQYNSTTSLDQLRDGFVRGLEQGGFKDGENVKIVFQNAQSDTGTLSLAMQQFQSEVDLVGLCSTQALQAAVRTIKDKPIVFCGVIDPVMAGAADSLDRPKAGVAGVYNPFPVTEGVDLIRKFMPGVKKIGTLYDPSEPFFEQMQEEAKAAVEVFGGEFIVVSVGGSNDILTGMQALKQRGVEAVLQLPSNTVNQGVDGQVKAARDLKMPIFSLQPDQLDKGVVAAIGVDLGKAGEEAGLMAAAILKGERRNVLQKSTNLPPSYRAENAEAFGLKVPEGL